MGREFVQWIMGRVIGSVLFLVVEAVGCMVG